MNKSGLYPLKFTPIYKHYLWGGRNLEKLGKKIAKDEIVAESWELADHDEDVSVVKNGPLSGKSLRELLSRYGEEICPKTANERFPIIIKYLDANQRLSVQVHPDDDYARTHESLSELGKNECWFVMEAPPGAELIFGIKKGVTKRAFQKLIEENRIEEGLNRLPISAGDFIFIRTGTVHALLEGTMVCEILQNSDTTYRLYDWGRLGADGKSRPLHIDKALDVINFPSDSEYEKYLEELVIRYDKQSLNYTQRLLRSRYFNVDLFNYRTEFGLEFNGEHFHTFSILAGDGELIYEKGTLPVERGETVLVPRTIKRYKVKTGGVKALRTFL